MDREVHAYSPQFKSKTITHLLIAFVKIGNTKLHCETKHHHFEVSYL